MSRVRQKNTKPEMVVRKLIHGMGYRYRLHRADLPGSPDLVFSSRQKVIFVNGCFWHQHDCGFYRMPHSRTEFWYPKLKRNVERDKAVRRALSQRGWEVLTIWECELKNVDRIRERIKDFLE